MRVPDLRLAAVDHHFHRLAPKFLFIDYVFPFCFHRVLSFHLSSRVRQIGGVSLTDVHIRLNQANGEAKWYSSKIEQWFFPSDPSLDAAVLPALVPVGSDHLVLTLSTIITPSVATELNIGVGEEVFVTGLFAHHVGNHRNAPIVRIGNLAAYPEERIQTGEFGEIDAYLIEARSIGGLSWVACVRAHRAGPLV